ncbi:hypothetical protein GCM10028801_31470 [Nocardioides maradonensis]
MSDIKDYLDQIGDLPADILLGRIVFFTIYDHPVTLPEIEKWFTELDLNRAFIPQENKRHDAFRKATKELDGLRYPMSGQRTGILLCRDVRTTGDQIIRSIVREIRDARNRKLTHAEAINCQFNRGGQFVHPIRGDLLEPEEIEHVRLAAQKMVARYNYHCAYLDNMKIRAMVRGYLKHLNCVEMKPGVYYVNHSRDDELHRLAELVNRLGGGCHMDMIPIPNIERQRKMLTGMFEREAVGQLQELTKQIEEAVASPGKISAAKYAKMAARFSEVLQNAEEHMITLDVTQDLTAAHSEIAQKALAAMQLKMLSEG